MSDDKVCCGMLEQVAEKFDLPFERPFLIDRESHDLKVGGWAVRLLKLTPSGAISKVGGAFLTLNYCPVCGQAIGGDAVEECV